VTCSGQDGNSEQDPNPHCQDEAARPGARPYACWLISRVTGSWKASGGTVWLAQLGPHNGYADGGPVWPSRTVGLGAQQRRLPATGRSAGAMPGSPVTGLP